VLVVVVVGDGASVAVDVSTEVGYGDPVLIGDTKGLLDGTTISVALEVFVQDDPTMVRTQNIKIIRFLLLFTFDHPIVLF